MLNTCALWGTTNYTNSWLPVNILIIVISLLAIAVAYSMSSFVPAANRGRMRGFVRFEMIQMIISAAIIAALLAFSATACGVSANISQSLTHTTMNPFQYADYYIGSDSLGTGLTLLSNIYSTSVSYSIYASVVKILPSAVLRLGVNQVPPFSGPVWQWITGKKNIFKTSALTKVCKGFCDWERIPSLDFSTLYSMFATLYLGVYSPIILVAVGLLFIQFLALPIMQYTAFVVILPVAIALRSIAFFGSGLADASNALIAIAIAFYIIYPMTVAFDSYAVAYVFSPTNPSSQYVNLAFTLNSVQPNSYFQGTPTGNFSAGSVMANETGLIFSSYSLTSYKFYAPALSIISTLRKYTNEMAQFLFVSILLFALNVSVTVGLAMSLYKALKSGLGEAGRFW